MLIGDGSGGSDVEGRGNGALTWPFGVSPPLSFRGSLGGQYLLVIGAEVVSSSVEALGVGMYVKRGKAAVI